MNIFKRIDNYLLSKPKLFHFCWFFEKLGLPVPRYLVGESSIDVGDTCIDRPSEAKKGRTTIAIGNPANASGILTSVCIWTMASCADVYIGVFYVVSGNTLKCRSVHHVGAMGHGQYTYGVNMAISVGDKIGVWSSGSTADGAFQYDITAGSGVWWLDGNYCTVGTQATFNTASPRALSVYGTGITIPDAPTNCIASYIATDNTKCTWTDNSDIETNFRIEVDIDDAGFVFWKNVGVNVTDSGNHSTGENKKIRFRVRAYHATGYSGWATSGYVYTSIAKERNIVYDSALWLGKTRDVVYDSILELSRTRNILYDSVLELSKTRNIIYDSILEVSKTRDILYDLILYVSKERDILYDLVLELSKERDIRYDSILELSQVRSILYDLFELIQRLKAPINGITREDAPLGLPGKEDVPTGVPTKESAPIGVITRENAPDGAPERMEKP